MLKFAILAVTLALASARFVDDWENYKLQYNKVYGENEDSLRREIYHSNMKMVHEHNKLYVQGKSSFFMGENQFADWTNEEFVKTMNGMDVNVEVGIDDEERGKSVGIPNSIDWRQKGYVTPVKDQGQCGSCWAFSATGSMEGQHYAATKKLVSLSESNLVDCSSRYGNHGCNGGVINNAFKYVIQNQGIDREASYPYKPRKHHCKFNRSDVGAEISGYEIISSCSEDALQRAVAEIGPISVVIDAKHQSFKMYKGGVYDEPKCSPNHLDHGVLVVGYGTTNDGTDYYIVKNSWSERWGNNGYIWMSRNKRNQCGIASAASYPKV